MKYSTCDRCGTKIEALDNQSDITVIANFDVPVGNFRVTVDLCEKCTKQFYTHFMNNHYCYKKEIEK